MHNVENPGVTNDISLHGKNGTYIYDQHMLAVNLERSSLFNLAGVPVNNSRVLALHCKMLAKSKQEVTLNNVNQAGNYDLPTLHTSTNSKRYLTVYLKYVKLARVFLNNVEVEQ